MSCFFCIIPRTDDGQCIVRARTDVEAGEAIATVFERSRLAREIWGSDERSQG